jgi:hypothetical protein
MGHACLFSLCIQECSTKAGPRQHTNRLSHSFLNCPRIAGADHEERLPFAGLALPRGFFFLAFDTWLFIVFAAARLSQDTILLYLAVEPL